MNNIYLEEIIRYYLDWGATKAEPEVEAIKQLQNRLDSLNKADCTDASQAEYLEVSKKLDDLLLKQEIYWAH